MMFILYLLTLVISVYIPENDDWTLLKPPQVGDLQTLPSRFGLVVTLKEEVQTQAFDISSSDTPVKTVACTDDSTLLMSLTGGILRDSNNRIGTIVSNRQFQFDGPTPQYGAIYANGWSIDSNGNLNLGDVSTFFQCSSGDYYNLYDSKIDINCNEVNLKVVGLIDC